MSALNEESVVSSNKTGNTIQLPEPELTNLVKELQKKVGVIERSLEIKNLHKHFAKRSHGPQKEIINARTLHQ